MFFINLSMGGAVSFAASHVLFSGIKAQLLPDALEISFSDSEESSVQLLVIALSQLGFNNSAINVLPARNSKAFFLLFES